MGVLNHHVDACNKYQHTDFSFSFYFLFCTTTPTRRPPQHLASAAADIRATPPTFAALARPPLTPKRKARPNRPCRRFQVGCLPPSIPQHPTVSLATPSTATTTGPTTVRDSIRLLRLQAIRDFLKAL